MLPTTRFTPQALGETLQQAAANLGLTSVPGLSPAATVVLLYTILWLVPFLVCLVHTARDLTDGLVNRYREGGPVGLATGLTSIGLNIFAVALYLLAGASVFLWAHPESQANFTAVVDSIARCTDFWGKHFPNLAPPLRLPPVATLGCAILVNICAGIAAWLLSWPYRIARERRTRSVLSQLEAQQAPVAPRRGTIRYWK